MAGGSPSASRGNRRSFENFCCSHFAAGAKCGNERINMSFSIELELQKLPKTIKLKDDKKAVLRQLLPEDEKEFHQFFQGIPEPERMFIKHRVQDLKVIHDWCKNIDYGRNLPLLGLIDRSEERRVGKEC